MTRNASVLHGDGPFWTGELDYGLPEQLIAQIPAARRELSRLMVVDRGSGEIHHSVFSEIAHWLPQRALLVANDSKVISARLRGHKRETGGAVEALLLGFGQAGIAPAMLRVAKPLREGQIIDFPAGVSARVASSPEQGRATLDFSPFAIADVLERCGEMPLPPYIERRHGPTKEDLSRYQTVYARSPGSVAAPTAGLHFSEALIADLAAAGFEFATVTLHVGPGTFTPVRSDVSAHRMEEESFEVPEQTAAKIQTARSQGRPVVAIGTTTVRALESSTTPDGTVAAGASRSDLFIRPGHRFHAVDALVTNFHLPGSTLLALVMALAGPERIRAAYELAVAEDYRFYSYGDAMLIR